MMSFRARMNGMLSVRIKRGAAMFNVLQRRNSILAMPLLALVALMLSGCGGDDSFFGGDPDPDTTAAVGSILVLASSPELPSVGTPPVKLTAFVRDANNALMPDVPVTFSADNDGSLLVTRPITDDAGTAQAELGTANNRSNREIRVTARAGGRVDTVNVRVVGTNLVVTGPSTGVIDEQIQLEVRLRDSAGNALAGEPLAVTVTSGPATLLSSASPVTGGNGQVAVDLLLTSSGTVTVQASGGGAVATSTIEVAGESNLVFLAPEVGRNITLGIGNATEIQVQLRLPEGGSLQGERIRFTATRGRFLLNSTDGELDSLVSPEVFTNADGRASVFLFAKDAGPSLVTATHLASASVAQREVQFVARKAASMTLQANPSLVGTNVVGGADEQSEIIAAVRDPNGNPVTGAVINFSLTDITGGSLSTAAAVTDVFGRATTDYIAGTTPSAQDGVRVDAIILSPDPEDASAVPVEASVALTTAKRALFITLGTGNIIEKPDSVRYRKPFGVLVTDAAGNPVPNARVTIEAWPTRYHKGRWELSEFIVGDTVIVRWNQVETLDGQWANGCPNEDINRNGIFDIPPDLDTNNNGRLDPGNVVTMDNANLITDASGFADFGVVYFQQFARWIDLELTARAVVSGSEGREQSFFRLPIAESDVTNRDVQPPGNPSPFGTSNTCTDTN